MIGHAERDTLVEGSSHEGQRAPLATAQRGDIAAVPLGQRREQVDAAHQPQVHTVHVILVAALKPHLQIVAEGMAQVAEGGIVERGIQPVNLGDQTDDALLLEIRALKGLHDGLHASPRRGEYHGARAGLGATGLHQVAIERVVAAVQVELHQESLYLLVGKGQIRLDGVFQGIFLRLVLGLLPILLEVLGQLGEGPYQLGREAHLHVVAVGLAVYA